MAVIPLCVGVTKGDAGGEDPPLASAQVASLALGPAGGQQLRAAATAGACPMR
jgi:hypothetical protein